MLCVCCCFVAGCYINLTGRGGPVAARRTAQQARAGYLPATKMVLMLRSRSFFIALYFCEKMVFGCVPRFSAMCSRLSPRSRLKITSLSAGLSSRVFCTLMPPGSLLSSSRWIFPAANKAEYGWRPTRRKSRDRQQFHHALVVIEHQKARFAVVLLVQGHQGFRSR